MELGAGGNLPSLEKAKKASWRKQPSERPEGQTVSSRLGWGERVVGRAC